MNIVIDTNILMAGFLKDSLVREILMSRKIKFYMPGLAIREIRKYESYLIEKSGYNKEDFEKLFSLLSQNIKLISKDAIKPHMKEAEEIMKEIDLKDSSFIATYLAINSDGLWSFDAHFKKQNKVRVFNIKELIEFI